VTQQLCAARDPANTEWQRDLSVSYVKIALVFAGQNERVEARGYLERALAISEKLAGLDPSNAVWKDDVQRMRAGLSALQDK
jgi:hypothetical protein